MGVRWVSDTHLTPIPGPRIVDLPLLEAVDGGDIGMVQGGEGLGFASESGQTLGVMRKRVRQDLDRDVAIELGITRPIDLSHAAIAKGRHNLEYA